MEVATVGIVNAAKLLIGLEQSCELAALVPTLRAVCVVTLEQGVQLKQFLAMPRLDCRLELAVDPVAVDAVPGDELAHQRQAFNAHIPEGACGVGAQQGDELVLTTGITGQRLGAAASRCAPPDAFLLEQDNLVAPLCKMQGAGAAGDSPTDHAHVAVD